MMNEKIAENGIVPEIAEALEKFGISIITEKDLNGSVVIEGNAIHLELNGKRKDIKLNLKDTNVRELIDKKDDFVYLLNVIDENYDEIKTFNEYITTLLNNKVLDIKEKDIDVYSHLELILEKHDAFLILPITRRYLYFIDKLRKSNVHEVKSGEEE